ncbi:DUF2075 domain-containing protein [Myxococcus sp. K15C18031901]|uniref:DNA/RNA helicase domain-containing protein n=1 Tax=Myxococcus dinghuensis TaxID=2906761 RepID=UPI0020A7B437|nr:DNA/RNA helicase domain-containing protein [Myxococcus dinghuensis]MCP3104154.1 DUF2075 domain-containing protein [Myxococcus dinghuensis]
MNHRAEPTSRSYYAAFISEFLQTPPQSILGTFTLQQGALQLPTEPEQVRAWERELSILTAALQSLGPKCHSWSVLFEVSLFRTGKRLDAVVLASGVVCVIEFKVGASRYAAEDVLQTERYAHDLRNFHGVSQTRIVVPVLCAESAPKKPVRVRHVDRVADLVETNAQTLGAALEAAAGLSGEAEPPLDWKTFQDSPYRPTPTIIEAAKALYAGHQVADIGRGDAASDSLLSTANALQDVIRRAEQLREKVVCFVTGTPGAGKTLLGLDLALTQQQSTHAPKALLSGNRPLVHVLTESLAADKASRTGIPKEQAKRTAEAAIQNLLGYLKQHHQDSKPPEHVIIFDEAQRAWNAEVGKKLLGRAQSEPSLFLAILDRLEWACLVCLVGPGQEINQGEGGLALWGEALFQSAAEGRPWRVLAAPQALRGGADVSGPGLLAGNPQTAFRVDEDPRLHLANSMRAFRNERHGRWVTLLLTGALDEAKRVADEMSEPPAYLTRDLNAAKAWLQRYRRGGRSTGLLASSNAVRLVAEGIPPAPRSNELDAIGHWFLKPYSDFRSSGALETPLSEFGCQGLEVDYAGVCWGGDLLWQEEHWLVRKMQAPHWKRVKAEDRQRFRLNSYRVLLTRARAGTVIYVPPGNDDDPTRRKDEFDATAQALSRAGCRSL